MKKLCLILLAISAAFSSLSAASLGPKDYQLPLIITPDQQVVFEQTPFGAIGFILYENPYPRLQVISTPATIISVTLTYNLSDTITFTPNSYYTTVPVYGNGKYLITIETSLGTYSRSFKIQGLPNYEYGDPRIPMPIGDQGKY